ncbi:sensor histidine kinase [Mycolicibacterium komossense]|uniref:histidine kinase n=1 Tax=Mycolicibacterium komossense TaxID=1779 RepID=A0ABT3CCR7_9MYCO|nr:ATP-binding protein [Mycolicibacterium komossense]MCV7227279.1 sensor histidine kinase [Mycolicibacterium komossense]
MTLFDKQPASDNSPAFDPPAGFDQPTGTAAPAVQNYPASAPVKRPRRLSVANWPVRWKVIAIALVPLLLAATFGGVRIYSSIGYARTLSVAADRAKLIPDINDYLAALENALVTDASGGDSAKAVADYTARKSELQQRLDNTDPQSDVRLAVTTLLNYGTDLMDKVDQKQVDLLQQVTIFAPLLLTAETAITGSVRVDDETLRLQAEGLSRAVGARGQMAMQRMLVERGGDLPEAALRLRMIGLAGTEPSTVTGMSQLLGGASEKAATLRSELVQRQAVLSDPTAQLVGNPQLLASIQTTDQIAQDLIGSTTSSITSTVDAEAAHQRNNAIRDAIAILAAFLIVLVIVFVISRSLVRPLRRLRDGALKIAHQDLASEIERVKAGDEREPDPLPIHTTEEIGQVAHAVDELHTQALLLAGDEARLRVMVNDMFETMSRRNKSLVDQQLSLIDRLEKNEEDPDRLDSLFRLDHLATRMRRNGANLLVLAGARVSREQADAVPLASLINAASSEVEDYQRVEMGAVPDAALIGSAAGDAVHLLAELIDNALRYSPPTEQVRVTAVHTSDGGMLIDIDDAGLGMTEADLRIANMRLNAGGEVSPDNTRHMGLFVVGRLARQHNMYVRLLAPASGSGTTAQLYVPPVLWEGATTSAPAPEFVESTEAEPVETEPVAEAPISLFEEVRPEVAAREEDAPAAVPEASVTMLPRRSPGSSGITGLPAESPFQEPDRPAKRPLPVPWWMDADEAAEESPADETPAAPEAPAPVNTSGFFASRRRARREAAEEKAAGAQAVSAPTQPQHSEPEPEPQPQPVYEPDELVDTISIDISDMNRLAAEMSAPHSTSSGPDWIYQNMVNEWLVDPDEIDAQPQEWKSVWDNGWAAAEDAQNKAVVSHTEQGLPVRDPGARLIPGGTANVAAGDTRSERPDKESGVASNGGVHPGSDLSETAEPEAPERDPDAIRASISNHFGGVRAGRSHARNTTQGLDHE